MKVIDVDELFPPLFTLLLLPSVAEFIVVSGGVASTFHLNGAEIRLGFQHYLLL